MRVTSMSKEKGKKKEKKKVISESVCRKVRRNDGYKMKFMCEYTFRNFYEVIESRYPKRMMYRKESRSFR